MKFGGFIYGANEEGVYMSPDPEKISALAEVQPPSSKTEVRAFLGLIRQLEAWRPNLSFLSKNMSLDPSTYPF